MADTSTLEQASSLKVPVIYANGIGIGLSLSDMFIILTVNGQPTHQLNLSLPTAKSLLESIKKAISDYENNTGTKVLDINELNDIVSKSKK